MEKFLSIKKAQLFNDQQAAMEIVKQSDPIVIKRLAKNISGFKGDIWEKEISSILEEGLSAKFEQNDRLAKLSVGNWQRYHCGSK